MQTGRKILNLRCDRKVSQQDLARACSITPSALSKIEAGINSPRANVIWRIAKNLGVTVEYLLDENMPYPYAGYNFRQEFLASNVDPGASVRMDVTREEKAFLEALRKTNQIARDAAMAIPEASVEHLRLVHFILNHAKVLNPSQVFLRSFESLFETQAVAGASPSGNGGGAEKKSATRGRKKAKARAGR
jgi:transcriptional regulator with XRE-family HTH domain